MKTPKRFLVAAVAATMALAGFGACKSAEPYAAKVNGTVLSKSGLDAELNAIKGNAEYLKALEGANVAVQGKGQGTFDQAFVARVLTRRIYLELIHQEVERRNLKVTSKDLDVARQQLVSSIGDEKVLDKFPKSYYTEIRRTTAEVYVLQNALADTSPANLKRYYEEHKDQFESVCAAHILVDSEDAAEKIEAQLAKAKDKQATFEEIARKDSKDTGSGADGGSLGCASPSNYVAEFKDAVRTQKLGVIGDPVKTQFGYHIIRVDSREAAKPFEEVEDQVKTAITDSQQGPFNEFLNKASTKAKVDVNPRYGTYDKSGESPQIVPPKAPANSTTNNSGN